MCNYIEHLTTKSNAILNAFNNVKLHIVEQLQFVEGFTINYNLLIKYLH